MGTTRTGCHPKISWGPSCEENQVRRGLSPVSGEKKRGKLPALPPHLIGWAALFRKWGPILSLHVMQWIENLRVREKWARDRLNFLFVLHGRRGGLLGPVVASRSSHVGGLVFVICMSWGLVFGLCGNCGLGNEAVGNIELG